MLSVLLVELLDLKLDLLDLLLQWKGIDLLGDDGKDSSNAEEASTDVTDKLTNTNALKDNWVTINQT